MVSDVELIAPIIAHTPRLPKWHMAQSPWARERAQGQRRRGNGEALPRDALCLARDVCPVQGGAGQQEETGAWLVYEEAA
mgnify:CR=1 FL=1